jgi:4-hydroxy-tetrahydrodipicolinate synthase
MNFAGIYTAMVTPFRNGKVDWEALEKLVEEQIAGGVAGLVPVGTTGESPTLDYEEHARVISEVIRVSAGRCQVIAGTGSNSTAEAIELTKHAKEAGADASLQVTPYYNKPTPEGLYRHFAAVADAAELPVVLYNVPGRSGVPIPVDVIARLSAHPMIQAVKEAGGSVDRVSQIKDCCDIAVLSGDDSLFLPMLSVGADGVISVASNIIPAEMTALYNAWVEGRAADAVALHRKYYPIFRDLFIEANPIPVKEAMVRMGKILREYRLPLCEMTPEHKEKLYKTMDRCLN